MPATETTGRDIVLGWVCVAYALLLTLVCTVLLIGGWGTLDDARSGICATVERVFASPDFTSLQREVRGPLLQALADRGTRCEAGGAATASWLTLRLSYEQLIIIQVALAGAIGALVYAMRSSIWYLGRGEFRASWVPWYLARPFLGMSLGILVYFVVRAGFMTPSARDAINPFGFMTPSARDAINPFGFIAVSALVGLFTEQALKRMQTVAEAVFQRPDMGPEPAPQRPAQTQAMAPRSLPVPTTQPRFQDGNA